MRKVKKGFTLVELLAVIAILAIVLLIAVPVILGVIEEAKVKSFRLSVMGVMDAIELEHARTGTTNGEVSKLPINNNPFLSGSWSVNDGTGTITIVDISDGTYEVGSMTNNDGEDFEVVKKGESPTLEITINGKNPDSISCSATGNYQDQGAKYKEESLTTTDVVDLTRAGSYILHYRYEAYQAKRIVHVTNTNQPTLNIKETAVTITKGDQFDPGIYIESASDPCEGDITERVQSVSSVNTDIAGEYTVTYKAKNYGNVETIKILTVTVLDLAAPEPVLPDIPIENNGWFDDEPEITIPENTNIDSYEYAISTDGGNTWSEYRPVIDGKVPIDVEGENVVVKIRGKRGDKYTEPIISKPMKVDLLPPTCVSSGGSTSWVKSLTLTGTCSDTVSGCANPTVTKLFNSTTNITNGSPGTVRDNAGHTTTCPSNQTVKVDTAKPGAPTIGGGSTTWTAGNRTFTASAPTSASGIKHYEYFIASDTNTAPTDATAAAGTGLTISQTGKFVFFRAVNNAGTKGTWTAALNLYVDKTTAAQLAAPRVTGGSTTWAQSRTFTMTAPSSTSGIKMYEYVSSSGNTVPGANPTLSGSSTTTSVVVNKTGKFVFFRAVNNAGVKGAWTAVQNAYVDIAAPTLTRKVASYSTTKGTSYAVTNLYTVSYGASGGSVTCKVGSTTVTNLSTLAAGSHTLSCTATSGAGKVSEIITVSITISNPAYLVDVVNVGDFVNYDAGTWTSTVAAPTSHGNFGGYTGGTNKSTSVTCHTRTPQYSGWRVFSKSGSGASGVVTLVHAGQPECYYHAFENSEYASASITALNNRANSQYVNSTYATSARNMACSDLTPYESTACTDNEPLIDNVLTITGGTYFIATARRTFGLWNVSFRGYNSYNDENGYPRAGLGIRPIVTLKAGIKKTGGSGTSSSAYNISI